ncbi:MAG: dihydropteroate synthase [Anaerolineae bacterium]|nr:dihydropteroate synthase [Anaerolineae bacterium]
MGILNITPDSFSGDGLLNQSNYIAAAIQQAHAFVAAGADILDIGGESTRPGSTPISAEEELQRVLPVIRALIQENLDCVLSIDTYKSSVAEAALNAGAHWINDIWGLRADPSIASVAARHRAPIILMHNRSQPSNVEVSSQLGGRYVNIHYQDLIAAIRADLLSSIEKAHAAGVADDHIILDPGIGFGKTVEQNLEIINWLSEIRSLGYPLLVGVSRKGFIGYTLNLPIHDRLEGTAAAVAISIAKGADIIRVHDVAALSRVIKMSDAIVRRGKD